MIGSIKGSAAFDVHCLFYFEHFAKEGRGRQDMEEGLLLKDRDGEVGRSGAGVVGWRVYMEEAKRVGCLAGPMVAVSLSQYLQQVISLMMVGHLGELALSSAAVATSLAEVTGFSLLMGIACTLETICGQAYGALQYKKLGVHTHRAIISLLLVCLPLSLIWVNMGKLLSLIGQDPEISLQAGKYILWLIPALFAYAVVQALIKYLQSQSLTMPLLLSSWATLFLHIPLCWALVFKSGLGSNGAALAISLSSWLNMLSFGLYVWLSPSCEKTRAPLTKEVFHGMFEFFRLALPSAGMMCLEWWSFELLILLSGLLPNPKLETSILSVCLTTISLLYTIPFGVGAATSTRVANELGAGRPRAARIAVCVALFLTAMDAIIVSSTLFGIRHIYGYAYSNEKEVVNYVAEMTPLICISVVMDNIQGVVSGVARGCGWQLWGALVNLGAFYLVGIPVAMVLAFVLHIGGKGLWIGILTGATVQSLLLSLITAFTNWQTQANNARKGVFEETLQNEELLK